jgi:hypothetical protein
MQEAKSALALLARVERSGFCDARVAVVNYADMTVWHESETRAIGKGRQQRGKKEAKDCWTIY